MSTSFQFPTKGARLAFFSMLAFYCTLGLLALSAFNFFFLEDTHPLLAEDVRYYFIVFPLLSASTYWLLSLFLGTSTFLSTLWILPLSVLGVGLFFPLWLETTSSDEQHLFLTQIFVFVILLASLHRTLSYALSHAPAQVLISFPESALEESIQHLLEQFSMRINRLHQDAFQSGNLWQRILIRLFADTVPQINSMEAQLGLGYWIFLDAALLPETSKESQAEEEESQVDAGLADSENESPFVKIPLYVSVRMGFNPLRWLLLPYILSPSQLLKEIPLTVASSGA